MADEPVPNWGNYPNLDDVITKADVESKGSFGTYVNHMKTAQLLRMHAPGWQFELRTTTDDQSRETHVYRAPDGSGYVVGFFRAPTGSGFLDTPDMPQSIMNNQNKAVQWDKISARDVTDTERRCMCVVAARHFGLAWQLWAKIDLEDPYRPEDKQAGPVNRKTAAPVHAPTQAQQPVIPKEGPLAEIRTERLSELRAISIDGFGKLYKEHGKVAIDGFRQAVKNRWNGAITAEKPTPDNLSTTEQFEWFIEWISTYKPPVRQ